MNALLTQLVKASLFLNDEEGQDLIEYSLIIVVIVLAAIVGMAALGGQIATIWATITTSLSGAGGGS
jgi:pilus assembly protein Flp/PilA